ncbi:hypothetical protein [Bradyrhizobium sp. SK17]|jgi:hypothetical protein|uniref:hypothetical protein n=2 Tax=Bradyrhizobium TaxID=374 RepID=UPI001FE18FAF|nr:hypothetical protein [Bradyrhizobium sp. SK17]
MIVSFASAPSRHQVPDDARVPPPEELSGECFLSLPLRNAYAGAFNSNEVFDMSKMPPIPKGNQSTKGPKQNAEAERDTSKGHRDIQNSSEQGETANIKQNTTNAGFFKGRRVK